MLDNDNIITGVSEAVEKIPTDEKMKKIIANVPLWCFTLRSHSMQRADQHIVISRNTYLVYLLGYI